MGKALIEKFHAHLDVCRRCRERPFDTCPEGTSLLEQAASPPQKCCPKNRSGDCPDHVSPGVRRSSERYEL
tara:strand:- start:1526 stop:1738 length:213 start_codon:yes stop_codon:yes gene_type:complete